MRLPLLFMLAAGSLISVTSVTSAYADAQCSDLRVLRSRSATVPADMVFKVSDNAGARRFRIYWINYDGERLLHGELGAGQMFKVNTYLTHPWLVTVPQPAGDEVCETVLTPKSGIRTVHLQ